MSVYFVSGFDSVGKPLAMPICVSTLVGNSLAVDLVHRFCAATFAKRGTLVDFLVLDMVEFDVILGLDWLALYHSILDCFAKTVTLSSSGVPRIT